MLILHFIQEKQIFQLNIILFFEKIINLMKNITIKMKN